MTDPSPKTAQQHPMTVLGGFLGAGKTTLLNRVLQQSEGTRYAVLVNDFGAINIDERLIVSHDGQTLALSNGCICCSLANGFIEALIDLMRRADEFDHILVEASGVANPARISDVAELDPELRPDGCIVLIDASQINSQISDPMISDLIHAQIASADLLLLNKIDLLETDMSAQALMQQLAEMTGPNVPCLPCCAASLPIDAILGAVSHGGTSATTQNKPRPAVQTSEHLSFKSILLTACTPIAKQDFERFVSALPAHIIRGKGSVQFQESGGQTQFWHRVGPRMSLEPLDVANRSTGKLTGRPVERQDESLDQTELLLISTQDLREVELMWQNMITNMAE